MNAQNGNGWPPSTGPTPSQNHEMHLQMQQRFPGGYGPSQPISQGPPAHLGTPVLPPPAPPVYAAQSSGPSLHTLANLTQASPLQSTRQPPVSQQQQHSPSLAHHPHPQSHSLPHQAASYPLPGINHAIQQQSPHSASSLDREREYRAQEIREMDERQRQQESMLREYERDREIREIQQPPHETHAGSIPLQQPVASRPAMLHGPNGILSSNGNVGVGLPSGPLGAPSGPGNAFANGMQPLHDGAGRMLLQHQAQNIPPQQLLGFSPGIPHQQLQAAMTQGQQPILNDALSYLDQVKLRFVEQPDVYNRFLDIMKDFKSQAIDTPGVIERVSTLFNGHPELVQGFNTFLPPGYRIECGTPGDPNSIRVTTPMGTHISQMSSISNHINGGPNGTQTEITRLSPRAGFSENVYRPSEGNWPHPTPMEVTSEGAFSPSANARTNGTYTQEQPKHRQEHQVLYRSREDEFTAADDADAAALAHQQEQQGVSQLQNAVSVATNGVQVRPSIMQVSPGREPAMTLGAVADMSVGTAGVPLAGQLGIEKRGPVEFNHAISYVNKIKNRFASQPEIYKQFLEILQTYQRESKPIQDVYAQVTQLFNAAPDLLEDFKQFLPESAAQAKAQAMARATEDATMLSNVRGDPNYLAGMPTGQVQTPRPDAKLPPIGNFAPPSVGKENKKRRGGAGSQITGGAAGTVPTDSVSTIGKHSRLETMQGGSVSKRARTQQPKPTIVEIPAISPTLIPELPHPLPPNSHSHNSQDEVAFFDRVRKYISNKQTFNEFLKLCNLFSQDLIDKNVLVHKASQFIGGNPDLMTFFKKFVLYSGHDEIIENKPILSDSKVALSHCRALGPSYRLLPKRERLKQCSGRDEMCQQVLNDEWVSHPTWASEDSGFVAHRKNQYEEALHRMEEERHDYDFNIETCWRTIQLLRPIAQQIKHMTEEEKQVYRLPRGLGGQSEAIYQRVIKKIYDRQKGARVIEDMFLRPAAVCPVVLMRLEQKAEEWRAGQREWEKVWREQTHKQFWRSLDHQGIGAKTENKRQFQPKSLQTEIQTKYEEQKRDKITPWFKSSKYQFEYRFDDSDVVHDACHLLLTYLQFAHSGNSGDQSKIQTFFRTFIPTFFGLDREAVQRRMSDIYDTSPPNEELEEEVQVSEDSTTTRNRRNANGKKATLLRDVLAKGQSGKSSRKDKDNGSVLESKESTPDVGSVDEDSTTPVDTPAEKSYMEHRWLEYPPRNPQHHQPDEPFLRENFSLYANLNIYCFMRMFQLLYERLSRIKENEMQVHQDVERAKAIKPAFDLKIADKGPSDYFADTNTHANYYQQVIKMCEDIVKGEDEMTHLEDTLRRFYLHNGFHLYNFDKMLAAILRFALQLLVNDTKDKSSDIVNLFYKNRRDDETTHGIEIEYRKSVEKLAKDADIYRIVYNRAKKMVNMQLFKKTDNTFEIDEMTAEHMWSYYVSSYSMMDRTEDIPYEKLQWPFFRRHLPKNLHDDKESNKVFWPKSYEDALVLRIDHKSYHLKYDSGTTEWFVHGNHVRHQGLKGMDETKNARRRRFRTKYCETNRYLRETASEEAGKIMEDFSEWYGSGISTEEARARRLELEGESLMTGT